MRRRIARRLVEVIAPQVWVIYDVSFPKCSRASAGVARHYCGALGKRANCQVAVSVHAVTDTVTCPLDWQLYLPREWTDKPGQRPGRHRPPGEMAACARSAGQRVRVGAQGPGRGRRGGLRRQHPIPLRLEERGLSYVLALTGKK